MHNKRPIMVHGARRRWRVLSIVVMFVHQLRSCIMKNRKQRLLSTGSLVQIIRSRERSLAEYLRQRAIELKNQIASSETSHDDDVKGKKISEIPTFMETDLHGRKKGNKASYFFRFDALIYCHLFPSDYEFDQDTLLQLWIAAGFRGYSAMEKITAVSFEDCISHGFFQFSGTNLFTLKPMYTFKGDAHTKLVNFSGGLVENFTDLKHLDCQTLHLALRFDDPIDCNVFVEVSRFKQLKTLLFLQGGKSSGITRIPQEFFLSMPLLHTLDLSRTSLIELPSSIGNLTCLKYLNLSDTPIKCLPETIGRLGKLQTLKLRGCTNISALPTRFRMLISLVHLEFDVLQCKSMPPGMRALTNLQTLSGFIVDNEEERSIRQLKDLNQLSGSLCISRLENVLTEEDAKEACLSYKSELMKLELNWSESQQDHDEGNSGVLALLTPNICLEELQISCYGGFRFPSWISSEKFSKLIKITLFNCENCRDFPSLGNLPSLKFLNISDFKSLKVIAPPFYGIFGRHMRTAFPKLEHLTFANMLSLEEWYICLDYRNFPRLLNLSLKNCPKLRSLQKISECISSLQSLAISHCELISCVPTSLLQSPLKELIVKECPLITNFFEQDQNLLQIAHISTVWLDYQEISLGRKIS